MKRRKFLNNTACAALGTEEAAATGRWLAIATSNFCGPQFAGMWRDIGWHRHLTGTIHSSAIDEGLNQSPLAVRMRQMANKY
jgi:hypothetical protein